jgi:hypothetical protein
MTGKELKKLSRTELLEILLHQVEENEQLRLHGRSRHASEQCI